MVHLVYPPNFCITIVFDFDVIFFGGAVGGTRCIMVYVKMVNDLLLGMFPCCLIIRENQFYSQWGIRALIAVA